MPDEVTPRRFPGRVRHFELFVIFSEHVAGVRIDEVRLRTRQAGHRLVFV